MVASVDPGIGPAAIRRFAHRKYGRVPGNAARRLTELTSNG
jgi:hypothetical protein